MKKLFVSILLITLLLTTTVFGQAIEVAFNKVNIAVNGQKVTTDNILYNGVTYVPLRAVSELLNKEVTWDSSTSTAGINDKIEQKSEYEFSSGNYTSGEDFVPGIYNIIAIKGNGNVSSSNMFDGGLNAIMGVNDDDFYEKEYKNVKLPKGTELTISGVTVKIVKK